MAAPVRAEAVAMQVAPVLQDPPDWLCKLCPGCITVLHSLLLAALAALDSTCYCLTLLPPPSMPPQQPGGKVLMVCRRMHTAAPAAPSPAATAAAVASPAGGLSPSSQCLGEALAPSATVGMIAVEAALATRLRRPCNGNHAAAQQAVLAAAAPPHSLMLVLLLQVPAHTLTSNLLLRLLLRLPLLLLLEC